MAEDAPAGDRTEAATPRRQARARSEGRVPLSREATTLATLAGGGAVLWFLGPVLTGQLLHRLAILAQEAPTLSPARATALALRAVALAAAPVVLASLAAAIGATLAQTGLLFRLAALMPDASRLDPRAGLKRALGIEGLKEAGRGLLKLAVLILVLRGQLAAMLPTLPGLLWRDPAALSGLLFGLIWHVALAALGVQAVFAAADLGLVRWRHARSLRMSREEVRQEHKETDGDPVVKSRIRRLRMARARRRMLAAVPTATVVVTNPTHYAVALFYQRAIGGAPRVVAKGIDHMAARIRETAEAHRVPLVASPPLARALHTVELDAEIPAEHFQAVAEIIAYIWRLDRRARPPL